ncbi:MAG TPA: recombinase family protein [Solirubrobacteraceae bacterium]|nr:recombinase family protein [Solirubrobacteraceae bacterium]
MGRHRDRRSKTRTGGRRKRVDLGFEIEATRDLRERHGAPQDVAHCGSLLLIWDLDADGDGIVCARLSAQDVQKGETAMAQIHNGLDLAASQRLTPACAVAMRTSGGAEYERRIDFAFIRDRIVAHGLKWVIYREPDRIARELHAAHSFYKFLRDSGTDLYLCSLGRKVSWDSQGDRLIVGTLGVIGEFERGAIKARTRNAIKSRWLETGRGLPRLQADRLSSGRAHVPRAGPRAVALHPPSQCDVRAAALRRRHQRS